jgi:hypothetical protein
MTAKDSAGLPNSPVDERLYSRRLPDALEYEVVFSAALYRAGKCEGLSSYEGNSSIANMRQLARIARIDAAGKLLA